MISRSVPSYSPAARPRSNAGGATRHRRQTPSVGVTTRHDASGSPHASHTGPMVLDVAAQQPSQTGPDVGVSSTRPQDAHSGAMSTVSSASASRSMRRQKEGCSAVPADKSILFSFHLLRELVPDGVPPQPFERVEG